MPQPKHFQGIFTRFMQEKHDAESADPSLTAYQEFPKHIQLRGGGYAVAKNAREERDILSDDMTAKVDLHPAAQEAAELSGRVAQLSDELETQKSAAAAEIERLTAELAALKAAPQAIGKPK